MAVCSFIGHRDVYDVDIESRVQPVIDRLVDSQEAVELFIYPQGDFSYVFLLAALRARVKCPQKVTVTLVSYHGAMGQMDQQELVYSYVSDKVILLNMQDVRGDGSILQRRKMLQWIVQNSTHLISYCYDALFDIAVQPVEDRETLEVINLAVPETEKAIPKATALMTEKEKSIYQKVIGGCTLKEAGEAIGMGSGRARQIMQHGCRTLRTDLRWQCGRALAAARQKQGPRTCGLFALGEVTYQSLVRFRRMMELLISAYDAHSVYVEQPLISSGFLYVLAEPASLRFISRWKVHITALVGAAKTDGDLDAIKTSSCPPCDAVGYVSRADSGGNTSDFNVIADMIERMDFCICNLSVTPHAEKIKQYAARTKRAVLLDIGRAAPALENGGR